MATTSAATAASVIGFMPRRIPWARGATCAEEHSRFRCDPLRCRSSKGTHMLSTIVIVLIILWLLGVVTAVTAGGLIHILLVVAIVIVLLRVIQGRNPLRG